MTRESRFDGLIAARDQIRLELHLLSMEAREKWDELETLILNLEGEVGERAERMTSASAARAAELADSVRGFVDEHVRKVRH